MKILYINKNTNLSTPIIENMKKMGFDVDVLIDGQLPTINKDSFAHRIKNIFYRVIMKDKNYYTKTETRIFQKYAEKRLRNKEYDIAFFIRADMYSHKLIKKVRKRSKKMINYQWDGMKVCENLIPHIVFFDKIFTFDPSDILQYKKFNFLPLTNCWFADPEKRYENKRDFFYVGVGTLNRQQLIKNFKNFIEDKYIMDAYLTVSTHDNMQTNEGVHFIHQPFSYEENIRYVEESHALLDFKLDYHNGLSFRFFEGMIYEKKIITNNGSAKKYDFYHPDNIFICDFKDFSGLPEFLKKPYHKLDPKIVSKYSIENWLRYALDIPPYTEIKLPAI